MVVVVVVGQDIQLTDESNQSHNTSYQYIKSIHPVSSSKPEPLNRPFSLTHTHTHTSLTPPLLPFLSLFSHTYTHQCESHVRLSPRHRRTHSLRGQDTETTTGTPFLRLLLHHCCYYYYYYYYYYALVSQSVCQSGSQSVTSNPFPTPPPHINLILFTA